MNVEKLTISPPVTQCESSVCVVRYFTLGVNAQHLHSPKPFFATCIEGVLWCWCQVTFANVSLQWHSNTHSRDEWINSSLWYLNAHTSPSIPLFLFSHRQLSRSIFEQNASSSFVLGPYIYINKNIYIAISDPSDGCSIAVQESTESFRFPKMVILATDDGQLPQTEVLAKRQ